MAVTAVAFAVAVALSAQAPALSALLLGVAFAIGVSRVYLGAHYPLDVLAGSAIGCAAGLLARAL